ncbi:hypothetical protein CKO27_11490 [Thiocystis violacea]|nr:hypothetical protein [Thiocystis violacea]
MHAITIQKLADACLRLGLVMIDLDTYFAFAETQFVENWRKLPERICQNYLENLEEDADVDADDDDDNDEDDEDI